MKILFLGDVVGSVGRLMINTHLKDLIEKNQIDIVIVNGENSAHGKGITSRIYNGFMENKIDVITMGNHTFSKGELLMSIDSMDALVRPINMEPVHKGQNHKILNINGKTLCVTNICGQIFMDKTCENPFDSMDNLLDQVKADMYFVDFHGEATSEKIVFANHYGDRCVGIVGTHTHVQTADERIIGKCGFISDAGMCGAYDSVLGRDTKEVTDLMVHCLRTKYTVAVGEGVLSGVVIEVDTDKCAATSIERIQIRPY